MTTEKSSGEIKRVLPRQDLPPRTGIVEQIKLQRELHKMRGDINVLAQHLAGVKQDMQQKINSLTDSANDDNEANRAKMNEIIDELHLLRQDIEINRKTLSNLINYVVDDIDATKKIIDLRSAAFDDYFKGA